MANATLVGIDLGKHCFFLHAQDAHGHEVWRKKATRTQLYTLMANCAACTVAMEACATSHYWGRVAQQSGNDVRLIPLVYVKPFVKRQKKNDATDAAAIADAVLRPNVHCVLP